MGIGWTMIHLVLMDIEGTTTSLSFVKDVLFPYSKRQLASYVRENQNRPWVEKCLQDVQETVAKENLTSSYSDSDSVEGLIEVLQQWIDEDRKHPALKTLQGYIWRKGYETEEYKAHVYEDVFSALPEWKKNGLRLGIYSSGSVEAQKLLFQHTVKGDLTPLIDYYFDTQVGGKSEEASYRAILQRTSLQGNQVLFLSDVERELDAAKAAGIRTLQLLRPGTVPGYNHAQVENFQQIILS